MYFASFILVASAAIRVAQADFMVYTVPPIPTDQIPRFTDPAEASGWTFSVLVAGNRAYTSYTSSLGPTYQSSLSSASSEIAIFVRNASNYSIPAAVTIADTTTTFFSRPDWYTALPSGARSLKERQVQDQFSIVRSVISAGSQRATATSTGGVKPTARAFLDAKFGAMAVVAAGVLL